MSGKYVVARMGKGMPPRMFEARFERYADALNAFCLLSSTPENWETISLRHEGLTLLYLRNHIGDLYQETDGTVWVSGQYFHNQTTWGSWEEFKADKDKPEHFNYVPLIDLDDDYTYPPRVGWSAEKTNDTL